MEGPLTFCISFSGITIRFLLPGHAQLPKSLTAFLCEDPGQVDEEFQICLIEQPLPVREQPDFSEGSIRLYQTEKGWLRVYSMLIEEDGCQVACLLSRDGRNKLFYPAARWDFYAEDFRCIHLIGIETILLKRSAFLLHSSVVCKDGKMVLFSGPSGAGKSTQANLWAEHLGAEVINGDRCVIMEKDGVFTGSGSPWSGTSGIYRREQAPIAGIFLVHQAPENSVVPLGRVAFSALFSQTVVNSWDSAFMERITGLFARLMTQIPVYQLNCRPDREAALLAYRTLF